MTTDTPPTAGAEGSEGRHASEPSSAPPVDGPQTVVVLVSASWAGPSRPAPTVLRELARRWGGTPTALLVEDPDDALLERWQVEHLPTWIACRRMEEGQTPVGADEEESPSVTPTEGAAPCVLTGLEGCTPTGDPLSLPGRWQVVRRHSGALPKHVVEAEFGPAGTRDARS